MAEKYTKYPRCPRKMKKELKKWIAYDAEFGEEAGDTFYDVQLFRIRRGLDDSFYLMHET